MTIDKLIQLGTRRKGHSTDDFEDWMVAASQKWDKLMAVVEAAKYIDENLGHWFLNPRGAQMLRESFENFRTELNELEKEE